MTSAYDEEIADLPLITPPVHRSAALLDQLNRRMRRGVELALAPLGLRPRHLVTLTVLRDAGGITQQGLASILQIDRTNLVGLLNELEADGFIERRRAPEDRRRHNVQLTDPGRRVLAKAEFELAAAESAVLDALDSEQREQLFLLLQAATAGSGGPCEADAGACLAEGAADAGACLGDDADAAC